MTKRDGEQSVQQPEIPAQIDLAWLGKQADEHNLRWLLMHADDGVNWGERQGQTWILSHGVAPEIAPAFVSDHLQQVRIFGETGELLLWKAGNKWQGRWLVEAPDDETVEDVHLLWGAEAKLLQNDFWLLNEGAEGLRHAVPAVKAQFDPAQERAALRIRHHLDYDPDGQVYVKASRLVKLDVEPRNKGG
jgi:CRISPR-associated protein (TIGR03984 family)